MKNFVMLYFQKMLSRLFFIFLLSATLLRGQNKTGINKNQVWLGYMTDVKLNDNWSMWNDFHFVTNNFFIARHGLTYHLSKNVSFTGGYAWLFLSTSFSDDLDRKEHRPWAQLFVSIPQEEWTLQQRIRYEARFKEKVQGQNIIGNEYDFTNRIRYMLNVRRKLDMEFFGNNKTFVSLNNEVLVNFGKNTSNNLDQFRVSLFYGYPMKKATFQLGYMYRYVPGSANTFTNYHGLVLWISQNFDWSKKEQE